MERLYNYLKHWCQPAIECRQLIPSYVMYFSIIFIFDHNDIHKASSRFYKIESFICNIHLHFEETTDCVYFGPSIDHSLSSLLCQSANLSLAWFLFYYFYSDVGQSFEAILSVFRHWEFTRSVMLSQMSTCLASDNSLKKGPKKKM